MKAARANPKCRNTVEPLDATATALAGNGKWNQAMAKLDELKAAIEKALDELMNAEEVLPETSEPGKPAQPSLVSGFRRVKAAVTVALERVEKEHPDMMDVFRQRYRRGMDQARSGHLQQAFVTFIQLEEYIKVLPRTGPKAPSPTGPGGPPPPEAVQVRNRLSALAMTLARASKRDPSGKIAKLKAEVDTAVKAKDFVKAKRLMDELEEVVKETVGPTTAASPSPKVVVASGLIKWSRARSEAAAGLKRVLDQMLDLRPAIVQTVESLEDPLDEFDDRLRRALNAGEQAITEAVRAAEAAASVGDGVRQTAQLELAKQKRQELRDALDDFLDELDADPMIEMLDQNPDFTLSLDDRLTAPLEELAAALAS